MDIYQTMRHQEENRLIKWAIQNRRDWDRICGEEPLSRHEFDTLSKRLLEEEFYQVSFLVYYQFAKQNGLPTF